MLTLRYNEPVFILMLRGRVGCLRQPTLPLSIRITGLSVTHYVLTEVTLKLAIFWDVTPCSFVHRYQRLEERLSPSSKYSALSPNHTHITLHQTTTRHNWQQKQSEDTNLLINSIKILTKSLKSKVNFASATVQNHVLWLFLSLHQWADIH